MSHRFVRRVALPAGAGEAFAWHERPGAFERLNPPWEPVQVIARTGGIRDGARVTLRVGIAPFTLRWTLEHAGYRPGEQFVDQQVQGPFALWRHVHRFLPLPAGGAGGSGCLLEDDLAWKLPLGVVGGLVSGPLVRRKLDALFRYRHRVTAQDLAAHARHAGAPRCAILLRCLGPRPAAGPGGPDLLLILAAYLGTAGHDVWRPGEDGTPVPAVSAELPAPPPPAAPARFHAVVGWRPEGAEPFGSVVEVETEARSARLRFGEVLLTGRGSLTRPLWPWSRLVVLKRLAVRPWIALDDWLGTIEDALHDPALDGEIDLTGPAVLARRRRWPDLAAALDHLLGRG